MHVYVRPRLAAAASRLIMGPWAAQSTRGPYRRPARSLWTLTRELYAEGRVLGSRTRLNCQLPFFTAGRSPRLPHGTPRGLSLHLKAARDPNGGQDDGRLVAANIRTSFF